MDGPTATSIAALIGVAVALGNAYRQDQRAKFTHMIIILSQLDSRFESAEFRTKRRLGAAWLLKGSPEADLSGEDAARDILNFFETLAFLHRREAIDSEAVWALFRVMAASILQSIRCAHEARLQRDGRTSSPPKTFAPC